MAKPDAPAEKPSKAESSADNEPKPVDALRDPDDWRHDTAAYVHGWREHAHHTGEPIQLTPAIYAAALEAVTKPFPITPHKPALSPHKGKGL